MTVVVRRMSTLLSAFAVLGSAATGPVLAASIEATVVGLNGYHSSPDTTEVAGTFNVSLDPNAIVSSWLRITGNLVWPSYCSCGSGFNGNSFFASMPAGAGEWYTEAVYVEDRVSFVATLVWQPSPGATWDFLSAGTGTVFLSCFAPPLPAGCQYLHGSSEGIAEVTSAEIHFELSNPTPVQQTTWGRIKALYGGD